MKLLWEMICVIEVTLVNLSLFSMNARARYSWKVIIPIFFVYSLFLFPFGIFIIRSLGVYGNGNGLFTLLGFFYLLPIRYLFKGTTKSHFYIICFCWVYSLLVFAISTHFGYLAANIDRVLMTTLMETALFLCTYLYVKDFVQMKYVPILECNDKKIANYLDKSSFVWFLTILMMNLQFVFTDNDILKIITLIILGLNIIYHFQLIYEILKQGNKIGSLQKQVTKDSLTGVGNRLGCSNAFDLKIENEESFTIIYCDLDDFKAINDTYGHVKGDLYLRTFAAHLTNCVGNDNVFRVSGDEFVLFVAHRKQAETLKELSRIHFTGETPFLGASYGTAIYPDEGTNLRALLNLADQNMYQNKQAKKTKMYHE